jgi:hypothetical protein
MLDQEKGAYIDALAVKMQDDIFAVCRVLKACQKLRLNAMRLQWTVQTGTIHASPLRQKRCLEATSEQPTKILEHGRLGVPQEEPPS